MANRNLGKIRQYKKTLNINLGLIFFIVIFIYIIVCIFMSLTTKRVAGYQVKTGTLFVDNVYSGLALREESIITSDYSGYLNYYVREGSRIGANKMVCTVDESGKLQDIIEEQNMGENSLSEDVLDDIRDDIMEFSHDFNKNDFSMTYDFKYAIEGNALKQANLNILENLEKLNRSGESGLINMCKAPVSGIVVYSYDGYENFNPTDITAEILKEEGYEKKRLVSNGLIAKSDPIYKLVTDENWSIIIQTDSEKADYLVEKEYVQVEFLKDQTVSWGEVSLITNKNGENFIKLDFNNSMLSFCTERFIDIKLIIEEQEGLKVPNSAIAEKDFFIVDEDYVQKNGVNGEYGVLKQIYDEDGNLTETFVVVTIYSKEDEKYYIDSPELELGDKLQKMDTTQVMTLENKGSLVGVYNKNKGYADFKQIQILYQNEEYSIIKPNTDYGLIEYDYIVLDAQMVTDDEFLN